MLILHKRSVASQHTSSPSDTGILFERLPKAAENGGVDNPPRQRRVLARILAEPLHLALLAERGVMVAGRYRTSEGVPVGTKRLDEARHQHIDVKDRPNLRWCWRSWERP